LTRPPRGEWARLGRPHGTWLRIGGMPQRISASFPYCISRIPSRRRHIARNKYRKRGEQTGSCLQAEPHRPGKVQYIRHKAEYIPSLWLGRASGTHRAPANTTAGTANTPRYIARRSGWKSACETPRGGIPQHRSGRLTFQ